jgi:uncharacterized membrane protein
MPPVTQLNATANQIPAEFSVRAGSSAPADPTSRWDSIHVALAILVIGIGVFLRWAFLQHQSLWSDEGYTLWVSRFSPADIWRSLENDASPPLYYVLLHYWDLLFGIDWMRGLSAFVGTLSIPLFYLLARKILVDKSAVVVAMALYAVSFFQIWYSNEARSYELFGFLSLATVYLLICRLERPSVLNACTLVLWITASLYAHNMTLFYFPGLMLLWFIYPAQMEIRKRFTDGLLIGFAVLALYIPWILKLRQQAKEIQGGFWISKPQPHDLLNSLCVLSGIDPGTIQKVVRQHLHIHRLAGNREIYFAVLLAFLLCAIGGLYAIRPADRRKTAALLAYVTAPLFLVFAVSLVSTPLYTDRAFIASCMMLPLLYCAPIAFQGGIRKRVFLMIGLGAFVVTSVCALAYMRQQRKEDWRGATQYLLRLPDGPRLAVVVPGADQVLIEYYESRLSRSNPPIEMTGLIRTFSLDDRAYTSVHFDPNVDVLANLKNAIGSGKYDEVDLVGMELPNAPEYLTAHCASVGIVGFHEVTVRRCMVKPTS